jgi:hypothetical protein
MGIRIMKAIHELFAFIDRHRTAACVAAVLFALGITGAIIIYSLSASVPAPTPTPVAPTAIPAATTVPAPSVTATPGPSPTPAPSPTVTPDIAIERSITPLDQYAPNHMVMVDKSMTSGMLSIDLAKTDAGGQYAYLNDTYVTRLALIDVANASIGRIKIRVSCINGTGTNDTIYEDERVDYVLLQPGDRIVRSVGFTVKPGTVPGKYLLRVEILADPYGNGSWSGYGCGFDAGLNVLLPPV